MRCAGSAGAAFILATALGTACELPPGTPFLTLAPQASAVYDEAPERAVEPGWQKLASEYQVRLQAAHLQIRSIELLAKPGAGPGAFDPAHPPPGYGPCHNGHCHAPDGRLLSYDEVAAAVAGPGASATSLATLSGASWDLLTAAAPVALACAPSCQLGRTHVGRLRVTFQRLTLEGVVRDGPGVTRPVSATGQPFSLVLDASAGALPPLTAAIDLPADNQHPPHVALVLQLAPTARLLDGVVWADGLTSAALTSVGEALAEIPLHISVQRH